MWCGKCQSDVAAEVSPDNQRVYCATCGAILSTIDVPPNRPSTEKFSDRTKDARELLQRWSSGKVIDPFGPAIRTPVLVINATPKIEPIQLNHEVSRSPIEPAAFGALVTSTPSAIEKTATLSPSASPLWPPESRPTQNTSLASEFGTSDKINNLPERLFPALPNPLAAISESVRPVLAASSSPFVGQSESSTPVVRPAANSPIVVAPNSKVFRVDAAHPAEHTASGAKSTSTDSIVPFASNASSAASSAETQREPKRPRLWFPTWDPAVRRSESSATGSWSSLAGQFLAYAGVLGMTAGACLVVWSHFGGPSNYAPTGWLLATAGQMLLFFGVVTLVSGGLEQTTEQVSKRIEQLGDHIIRIEQAARELSLRGNSIPPAHFGHDSDAAALQRSAASGYERSVVEE